MNARIPLAVVEESLYQSARKIHPRSVSGFFNRWRWFFVLATQLVFYGLAWLEWNGRQAVLFDLAARKFYLLGLVFWPQDVIYLAVLLVVAALALFLFTAVAGRLWCGFACPQTVYTEIFMWIERRIEGDRAARMKLDAAPRTPKKVAKKAAKHGVWILLALWTGFTFVGYFTPIRDMLHATLTFGFGPWEVFWIGFYAFATYGNAGWMREQVCKYMCPYARFQGAMFDRDTLIVTYDTARGEPRGGRSKKADPAALGLGSCVDCNICVQVCPTGIDIRQGLQYECIGCGACIDGCDGVMDRLGYSRGLIRFSTENALSEAPLAPGARARGGREGEARRILARLARPRVLVYGSILVVIVVAALAALLQRAPVKVDVIRDRSSIAREVEGDLIENVYRLQVMNTLERPVVLFLEARGEESLGPLEVMADLDPVVLEPLAMRSVGVRLRAKQGAMRGAKPIEFRIFTAGRDSPSIDLREKSRFLVP